ncbi:hypothetical protein SAMN05444583_11484 [Rhodococcus maanshanensis]|uniref:Uncharacterized protein n=1 Tax=Rhodococcus maanshanensis TaxID=183556 RepID=A0A1H7SXL2_9NOCA|nr:hypothetical protein SAMN05444583_11484 [Rhodococcus maanshanensis]
MAMGFGVLLLGAVLMLVMWLRQPDFILGRNLTRDIPRSRVRRKSQRRHGRKPRDPERIAGLSAVRCQLLGLLVMVKPLPMVPGRLGSLMASRMFLAEVTTCWGGWYH